MKIVHVSSASTWRGGEQQIFYLASYLQEINVGQSILCPKESVLSKRGKKADFKINTFLSFPLKALNCTFQLHRLLKKDKGLIVHAHDSTGLTAAYLCKKIFGDRFPLIVSRRIDDLPSNKNATRNKYKSCERIVCVSDKINEIMSGYLNSNENIVTVHSGINVEFTKSFPHEMNLREQFNIPSDCFLIGNTSAIAPHKDYSLFVDVAHALIQKTTKVHFVIVGDGPERDMIQEKVKSLSIDKHFTFTGFIQSASCLVKQFDLFLMTSKTEGLGTSIIDAMASEVPVVVSKVGGIPELINHKVNGFLVDGRDANIYAEHIYELMNDENLRSEFIERSNEKVQPFSYRETGRKTKLIYDELFQKYS